MVLPQKLKYLRKRMGLSQLELAEKLQVSRQAVSGWESGSSKPSTENLRCLGTLYGVPLEYVLNDDAPELMNHVGLINEKEINRGRSINIKIKSLVLVLIGIGIMVVILGTMFFMDRDKTSNRMNDMKGNEVKIESGFEMKW